MTRKQMKQLLKHMEQFTKDKLDEIEIRQNEICVKHPESHFACTCKNCVNEFIDNINNIELNNPMKTYKKLEALKKRREKRKENIKNYRALEILKIKRWKEENGCTCNSIVKCKNCQNTKKKKL